MTDILVKHISSTLSISKSQVTNTVKLLEEGATITIADWNILSI